MTTAAAVQTTGSMLACGMEPCAPRPRRLDRDAGSGKINAAAHHLALLDEIVDHIGIVRDRNSAGAPALTFCISNGPASKLTITLCRWRARRRDVAHPRHHAHACQDGDVDSARGTGRQNIMLPALPDRSALGRYKQTSRLVPLRGLCGSIFLGPERGVSDRDYRAR